MSATEPVLVIVRTGLGGLYHGRFVDEVEKIWRTPKREAGGRTVAYQGQRYRLHKNQNTDFFILLTEHAT